MTFCTLLTLYGPSDALKRACGLLENLPQVKRLSCTSDLSQMKLLSSEPIDENSLIPLLAQSGISGFRLNDAQKSSRNGSPLSL
ncbi:MAG: hypothetical protein ACI4WX_00560 [Aristaeellaceae bacterium]